jgi:predicted HAD superfamily phosphohydrolase YqeG
MFSRIGRYLKPDTYAPIWTNLIFRLFFEDGYRLVLLDVDNTLARHGSFAADEYARRAISRAQPAGLACRIVSNAGKKRIQAYAATLGLPFVAWARKPSAQGIREACRIENIEPEAAVMIVTSPDRHRQCAPGRLPAVLGPAPLQPGSAHVRIKRYWSASSFLATS